MTLLTALEIFSNPDDLVISVKKPSETGSYRVAILRGERHHYKPLLTGDSGSKDFERVLSHVELTLTTAAEASRKHLENGGPTAEIINPEADPIDDACVLTGERIAWIMTELREKGECSTATFCAAA